MSTTSIKSTPKLIVSDFARYELFLKVLEDRKNGIFKKEDDPILQNMIPYIYFTCDRDPEAVEPAINPLIYWYFWWVNEATSEVFDCIKPIPDAYVWTKRISDANLENYLTSLGIFPTVPRERTPVTLSSDEARQPSTTRDVEVEINFKFSSILSLNATATISYSTDGTTWSTGLVVSKNIALAANDTEPVTFIVPVGSFYKINLSNSEVTIDQIYELTL